MQVQILLQSKGLKLNPVTTMYYIAPASFLFLSIPWVFLEATTLFNDQSVSPSLCIDCGLSLAATRVCLMLRTRRCLGSDP